MDQLQPYMPFIIMILNGLLAGWLASLLLGGGGLFRMLLVGIIGAFIGGLLVKSGFLSNLPFNFGPWGNQIAVSTIGAIIVILLARIIGR